jgi:hypothetical protein
VATEGGPNDDCRADSDAFYLYSFDEDGVLATDGVVAAEFAGADASLVESGQFADLDGDGYLDLVLPPAETDWSGASGQTQWIRNASRPSTHCAPREISPLRPQPGDAVEIQEVDPLIWVQANPGKFFPGGKVDPVYLIAYLMADVLELGTGSCTIRRRDGWWLVGSDEDWLGTPRVAVDDLFRRVVATPGRGEHSMRGEVLTTAFARSVWTALDGTRAAIKGDEPSAPVWGEGAGLRRLIVFAL